MAVDERSEVRFFDPWSDVAMATNFLPILSAKATSNVWTGQVRTTSAIPATPFGNFGLGRKKLHPNTHLGNDCVATGSSMPSRGYAIGIMTLVTNSD